MKEKHLIDKFLEFEEENKLFDIEIRGIKIWSFIRFGVYSQIISKKNNLKKAHYKQNKISKFYNYLKNLFICLLFHNPFLLKKVDFLVFNHPRRMQVNDIWEEPYSDDFIRVNQTKKINIFESPFNGKHKKKVLNSRSIKYKDIMNNIATIGAKITKILFPLKKREIEIIENLEKQINSVFLSEVNISTIKYNIFYYKTYKKLLHFILKKTQPENIYEVVSYDPINMLINEIASEFKIPTIEFQHGTMGKYHIGYNYFSSEEKYDFLPDKVYFFNEFWKNNNRFPIIEQNKIVYGNPYMDKLVKFYKKSATKKGKQKILFLSQGTIGDKLSEFANNLSKNIDSKKYEIIYKLHPSEYFDWKKRYPNLVENKNIEVIDNNIKHLYKLFALSDIQIGVYSTALYEGLEFGLKTYILKEYGWEYMEEIIKEKRAILVKNITGIVV